MRAYLTAPPKGIAKLARGYGRKPSVAHRAVKIARALIEKPLDFL